MKCSKAYMGRTMQLTTVLLLWWFGYLRCGVTAADSGVKITSVEPLSSMFSGCRTMIGTPTVLLYHATSINIGRKTCADILPKARKHVSVHASTFSMVGELRRTASCGTRDLPIHRGVLHRCYYYYYYCSLQHVDSEIREKRKRPCSTSGGFCLQSVDSRPDYEVLARRPEILTIACCSCGNPNKQ